MTAVKCPLVSRRASRLPCTVPELRATASVGALGVQASLRRQAAPHAGLRLSFRMACQAAKGARLVSPSNQECGDSTLQARSPPPSLQKLKSSPSRSRPVHVTADAPFTVSSGPGPKPHQIALPLGLPGLDCVAVFGGDPAEQRRARGQRISASSSTGSAQSFGAAAPTGDPLEPHNAGGGPAGLPEQLSTQGSMGFFRRFHPKSMDYKRAPAVPQRIPCAGRPCAALLP